MSLDLKCLLARTFTPIGKIRRILGKVAHTSERDSIGESGGEATKPSVSLEPERPNSHREGQMRTIDEIVAATVKTTEAALREAFEAGRAHTASALKARMAAFFEGLISEAEGKVAVGHGEPPHSPEPPPAEPHRAEHHPDGHHG
jgi:hypothetical protein